LKENVFFIMLVYQRMKKCFRKGHGEGSLKMDTKVLYISKNTALMNR